MRKFGIGQSLPRSEDARLLQGHGHYTDDFTFPRQAYLYVLRSPHAAASIHSIDICAASQAPGVLAVLTGADAVADGLGVIPSRVKRYRPDGSPNFEPPYRALAVDRVRHVGDAVVAVIAETIASAKDAAELITVNYEPLPAVTSTDQTASPSAPRIWDEIPNNTCFFFEVGDKHAVNDAFSSAAHVTRLDLEVTRVSANPMEPRNATGIFDPGEERYTLFAGLQTPHGIRAELAEFIFKIPEANIRVVSPDCGGAFGLKIGVCPEIILVLWAARKTGRPVRWQCERGEAFQADHHARDQISTVELALDPAGRFLALRSSAIANLGAYLNVYGNHSPTNNLGGLSGTYMIPHIYASVVGVFSNTNPTSPYRGAGRPEASYAIERVIDVAAREMGVDRVELRRRNMIPASMLPYKTGFVFTYDSGEFEKNMDRVLSISEWKRFAERRADSERAGKLRGIGLASVIEIAGGPIAKPTEEHVEIRFDPSGCVTILSGTHAQGQGHETTFRQIAVEMLGLSPNKVRVTFGDTDQIHHGVGTYGSRSAFLVATALARASRRIIEKASLLAAHILEAAVADIEFTDGRFVIAGTDRAIDIHTLAKASYRLDALPNNFEPGLAATATVIPPGPTFPNGCHVCEIEVDPETGIVDVVGYWVVDDVGRVVNPALVAGQFHGGIAQGLGQGLFEAIRFDGKTGQLLTGSFLDYSMPRAEDIPRIVIESNEVLARTNPLGIKGAGEAGTVGAIPAFMNAINDALAPLGIRHLEMPATPERVWRAIRDARSAT